MISHQKQNDKNWNCPKKRMIEKCLCKIQVHDTNSRSCESTPRTGNTCHKLDGTSQFGDIKNSYYHKKRNNSYDLFFIYHFALFTLMLPDLTRSELKCSLQYLTEKLITIDIIMHYWLVLFLISAE